MAEGSALVKPKVENDTEDWLNCAEASQLLKQTMDGFLLVLSNEGDITYVSENIVDFLGITKVSKGICYSCIVLICFCFLRRSIRWANRSGSIRISVIMPRSRRCSI